jgi:hypothetical protein
MTRRSVLQAVGLTVIILIATNELTQRMSRNSVPRQVMRTIESAPTTIGVLGIGNSLIAAGFNSATMQQACSDAGRPCVAVNGGLGATGVIEHLLLTRLALRRHQVVVLVYGYFDQQLANDVVAKNSDIFGNRSMLYYQEPDVTLEYARFSPSERSLFQLCRSSALLRERGSIWAKVESVRRKLGSLGMPPQATNQFGRQSDFAFLEAKDSRKFVFECEKVIRSGDFLSTPVLALFKQCQERGTRVIVVEMPMHPVHIQRFYSEPIWKTFRAKTELAVERAGASYLDASAWITEPGLFADHLHLSSDGSRRFSQILVRHLINSTN